MFTITLGLAGFCSFAAVDADCADAFMPRHITTANTERYAHSISVLRLERMIRSPAVSFVWKVRPRERECAGPGHLSHGKAQA
jgi:hypothetical protein